MKFEIKKALMSFMTSAMVFSMFTMPAFAVDHYDATLYGRVEDNGQQIYKMVLDYKDVEVKDVDTSTYKVHALAKTTATDLEKDEIVYDYEADRKIVKVVPNGTQVEVYFDEGDGASGTLTYLLKGARNTPANITYTVEQTKDVNGETTDGHTTVIAKDTKYNCDTSNIIDEETARFESVKKDKGINYQFHKGTNNKLIVWFHGNGEGDYKSSNNNVAQMLANRGTVAWASDEANEVFGDASVMAFQAPDTWYNAQKDNLLKQAYDEINEVVEANGIDKSEIYVSGCSAGGYMTTRMLIAYPDLFKVAMINCPALDLASIRGGNTPTDKELQKIKDSKTAIWLVQGVTDGSVRTEDCSQRIFNYLTNGQDIMTSSHSQDIASDFTTYETTDNKYKLSLYETVDKEDKEDALGHTRATGKLVFAEDYDQDGVFTEVKYSDHWSWIYTLRNNPTDQAGIHIWNWAVDYKVQDTTPTVEKQEQKPQTKVEQVGKVQSVETGDASSMLPFATMMFASCAAMIEIKKRQ